MPGKYHQNTCLLKVSPFQSARFLQCANSMHQIFLSKAQAEGIILKLVTNRLATAFP
jgi:hypothetical protein